MKHRHNYTRTLAMLAAIAAIGLFAGQADARGVRIKRDLAATGVDPDARGQARVQIDQRGNDLRGRLDVMVRKLDRSATFEVNLQGVRIGTLRTSRGGSGVARFRSLARRNEQLLGVDPRGMQVQLRNAAGDAVMEADIPSDTLDPTKIRCCLPDDRDAGEQPECEDRTADECTAAGGVDLGAGSCLPNPCEASTPPPAEENIVCCIPDDQGPECEDRSAAQCSAAGGVNLGAGVCTPNPCAPTTPPAPETIQCCLTKSFEAEVECEDRTPDLCSAQGGTNMGPGNCSPDPCAALPPPPPSADEIRCCVAKSEGPECETRRPDQCAERGGTDIGPGSCVPNPCN